MPGGVDELALAHLGGVVDELEQQVAGRADGGHDAAGLLRVAGDAAGGELGSVISVTTALAARAVSTLPTRPAPLITGSPCWTPSSVPLLIARRWYQLFGECR